MVASLQLLSYFVCSFKNVTEGSMQIWAGLYNRNRSSQPSCSYSAWIWQDTVLKLWWQGRIQDFRFSGIEGTKWRAKRAVILATPIFAAEKRSFPPFSHHTLNNFLIQDVLGGGLQPHKPPLDPPLGGNLFRARFRVLAVPAITAWYTALPIMCRLLLRWNCYNKSLSVLRDTLLILFTIYVF